MHILHHINHPQEHCRPLQKCWTILIQGVKLFIISFWALILADWHSVTSSRFSGGIYENIMLLQLIRVW